MNRRGFLKIMASAGAAIAVPSFVLANPSELIADKPIHLGNIRALGLYDVNWDHFIVRLDAYNGIDQFGVDFRVHGLTPDEIRASYLRNRAIAEQVLRNSISAEGWRVSDMIALPAPADYRAPVWMQ